MIKSCPTCYNYGNNFRLCSVCDLGDGVKTQYRPKQTEIEREYDLACDEICDLQLEVSSLKNKFRTMYDLMSEQIEKLKVDNGQLRKLYADTAQKVIEFYEKQAKGE